MASFINIFSLIVLISTNQAMELLGSPHIHGISKIIYGKSNEKLVLTCEADAPIHWHLPKFFQNSFNYDSGIMSRVQVDNFEDKDTHKKNSPGYRYKTILTINPIWLDTGNYVCHYKTNNTEQQVANDRTERYVYIPDDNNLLVQPKGHVSGSLTAVTFAPVVIPCKPTHPNVTVILMHNRKQVYPYVADSDWTFDPQEGFKLDMMKPHLYGQYTCAVSNGKKNELVRYHIRMRVGAPKPLVNPSSLPKLLAAGGEFYLSCSVSYVAGRDVKLEWIVPNPEGIDGTRIEQGELTTGSRLIEGLEMITAFRKIRVRQAQDVDQGRYICRSNDQNETQETETFVRFYYYPFMEVSSETLNVGDAFTVKCHVTNCRAQSATLSFMECPPREKCTNKWRNVYPNGLNGEVVDTSSMGLQDTVTIIGRARVSGSYKCESTCYRNTFTKEIVVIDQAVIYNATENNVSVTEGENIYLFCLARTFSTPAVQWYKDDVMVTEGVTAITNGSSLLIESANEVHSGSYRCQFSNSESRTMYVAVKRSETFLFWVLFAVVFTFIGVIIGVYFYCQFMKRQMIRKVSRRSEDRQVLVGESWASSERSFREPFYFRDFSNNQIDEIPDKDDKISVGLVPHFWTPLPKSLIVAQKDEEDLPHHYANPTIFQYTKTDTNDYMIMKPKNNLEIAEPSHYMTMTGNFEPRPVTMKLGEEFNNEIFTEDWNQRNNPAIALTNLAYEKDSEEDQLQSTSNIYSDPFF